MVEGKIFAFGFSKKVRSFTPFDRMSGIRSVSCIRPTCQWQCPPLQVTSGAWQPGQTSCGPLTIHSHTFWWANVDTAEEQLAQIAAVQKKKFARKKPRGWPPTSCGGQVSGSGSGPGPGGLTLSKQGLVGSELCFTIGLTWLRPASVWPPCFLAHFWSKKVLFCLPKTWNSFWSPWILKIRNPRLKPKLLIRHVTLFELKQKRPFFGVFWSIRMLFTFQFELCRVTYPIIRLEVWISNFNFSWG